MTFVNQFNFGLIKYYIRFYTFSLTYTVTFFKVVFIQTKLTAITQILIYEVNTCISSCICPFNHLCSTVKYNVINV